MLRAVGAAIRYVSAEHCRLLRLSVAIRVFHCSYAPRFGYAPD